jgi:hypothetical protein
MNLTFIRGLGFKVTITSQFIAALSGLFVVIFHSEKLAPSIEMARAIFHWW